MWGSILDSTPEMDKSWMTVRLFVHFMKCNRFTVIMTGSSGGNTKSSLGSSYKGYFQMIWTNYKWVWICFATLINMFVWYRPHQMSHQYNFNNFFAKIIHTTPESPVKISWQHTVYMWFVLFLCNCLQVVLHRSINHQFSAWETTPRAKKQPMLLLALSVR